MEEIRQWITNNLPELISYILNFIFYILFFLYKHKVISTKNTLGVLFKEKTSEVDNTDKALRKDMKVQEEKIQLLEQEITHLTKVISILLEDSKDEIPNDGRDRESIEKDRQG